MQLVYPKSDEQRARLTEAVKNILLFRALDEVKKKKKERNLSVVHVLVHAHLYTHTCTLINIIIIIIHCHDDRAGAVVTKQARILLIYLRKKKIYTRISQSNS